MDKDINKWFILSLEQEMKNNKDFCPRDFFKLKNNFSSKNKVSNVRNIDLIQAYRQLILENKISKNKNLEWIISIRKVRSQSWVAVITCLTKPFACPWKCVYCPSEINMPKSYLSNQPAAMRAVLNKFDPFNQVQNRLASLMVTGHDISKIEIIIIWWTWSFLPKQYQTSYIKSIYDWLNQKIDPKLINTQWDIFKVPKIERLEKSKTLKQAISKNEKSNYKCVWMTLETRPDFIDEKEILTMRNYWCTRVEIWVQSLFDDVSEITKRWHTRAQTANATKLLRDSWFKISYHLMPGLPWSNTEKDIETVRLTFEDENFKPDLIKFYPCVVTPFTELEKIWRAWNFKAMDEIELKPILIKIKKLVKKWCRITRLVRDIPSESILAWCKIINLRQLIHDEMRTKKIKCNCIRCREIKWDIIKLENVKMIRENYKANWWDEIFLTFDDVKRDKLISLLRLRIPSQYFEKKKHFIKELNWAAIIREIHTYWIHTSVWENDWNTQHFWFWKKLLKEAERISKEEYWLNKVAVIAWVWVRKYYEKNWYSLVGSYMVKEIT